MAAVYLHFLKECWKAPKYYIYQTDKHKNQQHLQVCRYGVKAHGMKVEEDWFY